MQQNLNKLNFDEITKGVGYVTCDSKRTLKTRSKTTEDNTEEDFIEETDGHPDRARRTKQGRSRVGLLVCAMFGKNPPRPTQRHIPLGRREPKQCIYQRSSG
jgi:hypothetical protein